MKALFHSASNFEPEVCSVALRSRTYQASRLEGLGPSSQLVKRCAAALLPDIALHNPPDYQPGLHEDCTLIFLQHVPPGGEHCSHPHLVPLCTHSSVSFTSSVCVYRKCVCYWSHGAVIGDRSVSLTLFKHVKHIYTFIPLWNSMLATTNQYLISEQPPAARYHGDDEWFHGWSRTPSIVSDQ